MRYFEYDLGETLIQVLWNNGPNQIVQKKYIQLKFWHQYDLIFFDLGMFC